METLLTRPEVEQFCRVSRSKIYRGLKEGWFPPAIRVGPRSVRWRLSDLEEWLDSRPVATGETPDAVVAAGQTEETPALARPGFLFPRVDVSVPRTLRHAGVILVQRYQRSTPPREASCAGWQWKAERAVEKSGQADAMNRP